MWQKMLLKPMEQKNVKLLLISIIVLASCSLVKPSNQNSKVEKEIIQYEISKEAESLVKKELDSKPGEYFCIISKADTDKMGFLFCKDSIFVKKLENSNRRIKIGKKLIPIAFDSDLLLSDLFNERDGKGVVSISGNFGGLYVIYEGRFISGEIISWSWVIG